MKNILLKQFIKYVFVGAVAFIADYFFLWFLTEFIKIYYLVSSAISFIIGLIINYSLSIKWVFDKRKLISQKNIEFIVFSIIGLAGLIINQFLIWFFTEKIRIFYLYSKLIAAVVVIMWNFGVRKILLFSYE